MDKTDLARFVNSVLSKYGFRKKAMAWYRGTDGSVQVIDLQKSNFSNSFYVNIAFAPAGMNIDGFPTPKENKCPIRIRLSAAFPDEKSTIEDAFNLDIEKDDEKRYIDIEIILDKITLPFLDEMKDSDSIRNSIKNGLLKNGMVYLSAKEFLGIEDD